VTVTDHDDPAEAQAPPVVVALVTRDAGPWLEECLASIAAQDYPNLSVLVLAAGSADDTLARVAAILPSAYVRRLDGDPGFGPAANDVLHVVDGAAFYAFCHDDVVLDGHAIRALVEEAYRSNAGIVGPKLVRWHQPEHLLEVGMSVDKTGVVSSLVERGELDQEQHDAVRDVFVIPGGCTLVRADLFGTLGGFDPAIELVGEDLDLCWRAQVAGARVVVVPAARVQHRESLSDRPPPEKLGDLAARHRLRTVLTCYGRFHLLRVLPQLLVLSVAEMVFGLVAGRRQLTKEQFGAWSWNLRRLSEIRARRTSLRAVRQFPDSEVRRLQVGGSVRVRSYVRGELHAGERLRTQFAGLGRELSDGTSGPLKVVFTAWALVTLLFLVGTRGLLLRKLPAIGGLAPFDQSVGDLVRTYLSGWRHAGLGADAPQPTAFGLLGLAGIPFLGGMGLLQQVLVLGTIPAGVIGSWRLTRPLGSRLGRAAAMVVYAVVALPYDSLAKGSWAGLLVYAAAPWILIRLIAACGDLPSAHGRAERRRDLRAILGLGVLVALVAAFVPLVVVLVPIVALALVLGALLTGGARRAVGALGVAAAASGVAVVLHVPWTFDFLLPGSDWWGLGGVSPLVQHAPSVVDLLRFHTGDGPLSLFGWAVPVAAALPLVIGRDWRFAWAVRCWCVALACWSLAWAGGQGLLGVDLPPADVLLAPAAAALSLSVALGAVAFERDLRGYHFGWRQVASLVAGAAVLLAVVPTLSRAVDGRWDLPSSDDAASLSFLRRAAVQDDGAFRVLWLGDPEVLPVAGFRLDDDLAYGFSENGVGSLTERWAAPTYGATALVSDALHLAARGDTERLGRMLGPLGVRYVLLAGRAAPDRTGATRRPVPAGLAATVGRQLDLRRIDVDPALTLYENTAWVPQRAHVEGRAATEALAAGSSLRVAAATDLGSAAEPVLTHRAGAARYTGRVGAGTVFVAEGADAGWQLRVDGEVAERSKALGWGNRFEVARAGDATLRYRTSPLRWAAVAVQLALWLGVAAWFLRDRRRRRAGSELIG
jgi:GT2 family glycosyltransferase